MKTYLWIILIAPLFFPNINSAQDIKLDVEGNAKIVGKVDLVLNDQDNTSLAIGKRAGDNIVTIDVGFNTFLGYQAGWNTTQGNESGINNTFLGASSGQSNISGRGNSFFGSRSGANVIHSKFNSFFGNSAGHTSRAGFGNTIVGAFSEFSTGIDSLNRAIALGFGSKVGCSNCASIGGTHADAVFLGLGIDQPIQKLHLHQDSSDLENYIKITDNQSGCGPLDGLQFGLDKDGGPAELIFLENNDFRILSGTNPGISMYFKSQGKIGIGIENPQEKLHIYDEAVGSNAVIKIGVESSGLTASDGMDIGLNSDASGIINQHENKDLIISTNNTPRMTIKNDGKIGIGTETPTQELEVVGNIEAKGTFIQIREGSQTVVMGTNEAQNYVRLDVGGTGHTTDDIILGDPNGAVNKVGLGTSAPTELLDVNGNIRVRSVGTGANVNDIGITSNGELTTTSSDLRLKTDIRTFPGALKKLMAIRGVSFQWKEDLDRPAQLGVVAQEVQKSIPEVVFLNNEYLGVNYSQLSAVFIEAIKEQQKQIEELRNLVKDLAAEVNALSN